MRALVLSGGGAKAAYQVGALRHLILECGRTYDLFCGSSGGALNAAKLACYHDDSQALKELEKLWFSVTPRSVFKPWSHGLLGPVGGFLRGKGSAYNSKPLQDLVDRNISREDLIHSGKMLTVGATSATTGDYFYWRETDANIIPAIKASCAYPGVFLPVELENQLWIDSGVREFTPLAEAVYLGAKEIDVIMLSNMQIPKFVKENPNPLDLARRALEIIMFRLDLWDLKIVSYAYEGVTIRTLIPTDDLGSFMNFNQDNIKRLHQIGYEDAKAFSKKYNL